MIAYTYRLCSGTWTISDDEEEARKVVTEVVIERSEPYPLHVLCDRLRQVAKWSEWQCASGMLDNVNFWSFGHRADKNTDVHYRAWIERTDGGSLSLAEIDYAADRMGMNYTRRS